MPRPKKVDWVLVESRREQFDQRLKHGRTKILCGFDWWFERFQNDCLSFQAIGVEAGYKPEAAREAARQIFNRYFSDLLSNRPNGRIRQKFCSLKTSRLKSLDYTEAIPSVQKICRLASELGYKVELETKLYGNKYVVMATSIVVNGWHTKVYSHTGICWPNGKSGVPYFSTTLNRNVVKKYHFVIVYQEVPGPERVYIIPTSILLQCWPEEKALKVFNIPLVEEYRVYNNRHPQIDYAQYLNAWHLLKPNTADS